MERVMTSLTKENKELVEQQKELKIKNDVHTQLFKTMSQQLGQILDAVSVGKAPIECLSLAKNVLHMPTPRFQIVHKMMVRYNDVEHSVLDYGYAGRFLRFIYVWFLMF